jgi:hypothetical protein
VETIVVVTVEAARGWAASPGTATDRQQRDRQRHHDDAGVVGRMVMPIPTKNRARRVVPPTPGR